MKSVHNCTNPPHFPPHCGCPAGAAPRPALPVVVRHLSEKQAQR